MKVTPICEICFEPSGFTRRNKPRRFCSVECNSEWRRRRWIGNKLRSGLAQVNAFPKGHEPWNKNKKGIHLSPNTEFKPGHKGTRKDAVGTVRIRCDHGAGNQRAWIKVAEPNKWRLRAIVVFELANGPIKKGGLVHHKDRNTLNDVLENLELLDRASHIKEHRDELIAAKHRKLSRRAASPKKHRKRYSRSDHYRDVRTIQGGIATTQK